MHRGGARLVPGRARKFESANAEGLTSAEGKSYTTLLVAVWSEPLETHFKDRHIRLGGRQTQEPAGCRETLRQTA